MLLMLLWLAARISLYYNSYFHSLEKQGMSMVGEAKGVGREGGIKLVFVVVVVMVGVVIGS